MIKTDNRIFLLEEINKFTQAGKYMIADLIIKISI
jgi:hypothetical protein